MVTSKHLSFILVFVGIICVLIESVAGIVASDFAAPRCARPRGQFPHLRVCNWYYNCWDNNVVESKCPKGQMFNPDPEKPYCDWPSAVDCARLGKIVVDDTVPLTGQWTCPMPNGIFEDLADCAAYYVCNLGRSSRNICPPNYLFNRVEKQCMYWVNANCYGSQSSGASANYYNTYNQDANAQYQGTFGRRYLLFPGPIVNPSQGNGRR